MPYQKSLDTETTMLRHLLRVFLPNAHGVTHKWVQWGSWTWYPCSHVRWQQKCGLSRIQVRQVDKRLEEAGIIDTVVFPYRGAPTKHYHLYVKEALARLDEIAPQTVQCSPQFSQCPPQFSQSIKSQNHYHSSDELLQFINSTSDADASQKPSASGPMGVKDMGGKHSGEVLKEILKKQNSTPVAPEKVTASTLSKHWLKIVPMVVEKTLHRPHTMKELGMLTQYVKITGEHALPAMEWALRNWARFRYRAQEQLGVALPSHPTVWALLRGCSEAVEGYVSDKQKQVVTTPVQSPQLQLNAHLGEPEPKATKAEVEQYLKDMASDEE